jgi:hypothetical protein
MIAQADNHHGDEVSLMDPDGNKATGIANLDPMTQTLWLRAFSVRVVFARHTSAGWHRVGQILVVWHQPDLISHT